MKRYLQKKDLPWSPAGTIWKQREYYVMPSAEVKGKDLCLYNGEEKNSDWFEPIEDGGDKESEEERIDCPPREDGACFHGGKCITEGFSGPWEYCPDCLKENKPPTAAKEKIEYMHISSEMDKDSQKMANIMNKIIDTINEMRGL